ncbi:hypothetical protein ACIG56_22280 [Nocardia fusca]|uniref:hypothetical protein n=1 Tax=Nocardia fusca TaxID=941183 RepID=UPI0037C769FB
MITPWPILILVDTAAGKQAPPYLEAEFELQWHHQLPLGAGRQRRYAPHDLAFSSRAHCDESFMSLPYGIVR